MSGRDWVDALPGVLLRQREAIIALLEFSETEPGVTSLSVGCSLGRGAADALSDVDAALGVEQSPTDVECALVALLPGLGDVVGLLRRPTLVGTATIHQVFVQYADGLQLDLAVVPQHEVRVGDAAPDFVTLYWTAGPDEARNAPSALRATPEQVHDWAFLGWRALLDTDKYLRRGSLWEAHQRLHESREFTWRLWAAATGASYPWHGLSQVLDRDPSDLPPGVESTVAGLEDGDLRHAMLAAAGVLENVSAQAAERSNAELPADLATYVRDRLGGQGTASRPL